MSHRTVQSQGAVMTTILNTMASKKGDYEKGVVTNCGLSLAIADRLAIGGSLEEELLTMIKGSDDDENLIPEEEIQEFLTKQRDRLKKLAESNAERQGRIDDFVGAITQLKQKAANDTGDGDGTEYEAVIQELMQQEATRRQAAEKDTKESKFYKEMCETLGEKVASRDGADDDDIEVVRNNNENELKYKCPFTSTWMDDPVRSSVCNHVFSREGIMHHLNGTMRKCPVAGCTNSNMTKDELKDDPQTAQMVRRAKRRQAKEEEHRAKSQAMDLDDDEEDEA